MSHRIQTYATVTEVDVASVARVHLAARGIVAGVEVIHVLTTDLVVATTARCGAEACLF